jgi:hypothetical protein
MSPSRVYQKVTSFYKGKRGTVLTLYSFLHFHSGMANSQRREHKGEHSKRFDKLEATQDEHGKLLRTILDRLPQPKGE